MTSFATRQLGRTDLQLTELGLGCAAMAGNHRPVDDDDIAGAIDEALNSPINFVDTAPFYGFGRSEHFVGRGIRDKAKVVLSTKVGRLLSPGFTTDPVALEWPGSFPFHPVYDYSYDGIMRSYEDSLQRLGVANIDILLIHDIGEMQHGKTENARHFAAAMSGGYKALDELRSAGEVKAIGLGVNEREVCLAAMEHGHWDTFLLAGRYTLLEQEPLDDLFPACERAGTSIILGGPFNSGILVGGDTWNYATAPQEVVNKVNDIARVCNEYSIPLPAAALQFPLANALVTSVIPGPRSRQDVRQILEWFQLDIPDSLWSDLKSESLLHPDAP